MLSVEAPQNRPQRFDRRPLVAAPAVTYARKEYEADRELGASPSHLAELAGIAKARWIVVLRVYLDESEQRRITSYALAGCVYDPQACADFEDRWRAALASVKPHLRRFHMSEFENHRGPFKDWSNPARHEFFRRLARMIRLTARHQIGVVVDLDAWESLPADDRARFRDTKPYSLAAAYVFRNIAGVTGQSGPIAYVFDQASSGMGQDRILKEYRFLQKRHHDAHWFRSSSFLWADSVEVPELQAADIVAYEMAKRGPRLFGRSGWRERHSWGLLFDQPDAPPPHIFRVGAQELQRMLATIRSDPEGLLE